jgi:enamine deaminase RidA (YjgF/YER057c/UK114 family)
VDRPVSDSPHRIVNPETLPAAVGFAHAVVPAEGQLVFLGGQTGHRRDGELAGKTLIEQMDQACANVVEALTGAGGRPEHLVSMQILVTDASDYRARTAEIGDVWRRHFGKHYPAMALLEVGALFDEDAVVELMGVAVVPEGG